MLAQNGYRPMMSAQRALRIRAWHDTTVSASKLDSPMQIRYLGRSLVVNPGVFVPTAVSPLLGRAVLREVRATDRVLDVGTGSGVNAVLAASKATEIIAIDINPAAIDCAKANAKRNGVDDRITFLESDLFSQVNGRFDLIIFDPPFRWFAPRNMEERARTDENYATLTGFVNHVVERLRPGGRVLLFFGTSGDIRYLRHLLKHIALARRVIAQEEVTKNGLKLRYFTYRLTARA
jgi:release factor glutamine methyltransferase